MSTLRAFYPPIDEAPQTGNLPLGNLQTVSVGVNGLAESRSTPSILSLPIKNPATLIAIYEACLKPLYTMNITLLDKLHNRSNYSLLLIHLHHRFISLFRELNGFRKMISLSGASESDDSLSNFCFIRSLLADFDEKFGKFLEDLDTINSQIFSNAAFWGLVDLSSIYNKIVSKPFDGEIFVLKDTEKLESLRVSVLLLSDSLQLYKRLDGKFDSKAIVSEDLTNFRNELSRTLKYGQNCVREEEVEERSVQKHYKPSPEDLDIVSSPQFKQFNARRLQLLGLFDKRIF